MICLFLFFCQFKIICYYILITMPPIPSLGNIAVLAAFKRPEEKIKSLSITEVSYGKIEEAIRTAQEHLTQFSDIKGYEFKPDIYETLEEGLTLRGSRTPDLDADFQVVLN